MKTLAAVAALTACACAATARFALPEASDAAAARTCLEQGYLYFVRVAPQEVYCLRTNVADEPQARRAADVLAEDR